MSLEAHHGRALIEEAQLQFDAVHRAALAADAGGLRRGLAAADAALDGAAKAGLDGAVNGVVTEVRGAIAKALADLEAGSLLEMEAFIEAARSRLAAV